MPQNLFARVDHYIEDLFLPADPVLDQVLANARTAGMPEIHVSPLQGRFLGFMAGLTGAKRVLEIGTLAGYSAICMARALPADGALLTLELDPEQARLCQQHFDLAGLADRIRILIGPALDTLPTLADQPPFDMVFIDADKPGYSDYLDWSLRLTRPGGLIIADNVVRAGRILDPSAVSDPIERGNAEAVDAFNRKLAALANAGRVDSIVLQQIGAKDHDGLALIRVK